MWLRPHKSCNTNNYKKDMHTKQQNVQEKRVRYAF